MITVGREVALGAGVENLHWVVARAEDLNAPEDAFELITIGEVFHRFDRVSVARRALAWLKLSGHLATMGCFGITQSHEEWQVALRIVAKQWAASLTQRSATPKAAAVPDTTASVRGKDHDEQVLEATGFMNVRSYEFPYLHEWTLESIIGNLYSTSTCSRRVIGEKTEAFETAIKEAFLGYGDNGRYVETMRFAYTLAKRPSD